MKFFTFLFLIICFSKADGQFVESTDDFGISVLNNNPLYGNGSCMVDFDGDGQDDLTLAGKNQQVKFYKNNNGILSQYFMAFSPALPTNIDVKCPLWVDYDNDGDKDLILTGVYTPMRIYNNNGAMSFTDVAAVSGITPESAITIGVSAGDYNNDGCLDLYLCKYHNHLLFDEYEYSNHLYQNNCDGTFTDITMTSGIGMHIQASFCCVWIDYNMDGFQDIYVVNDKYTYPNYMYKNNGDGTFTDVTTTCGAGVNIDAMTATCDDYDQDGDLDIFVTNTFTTPDMQYNSNKLLNYDSETETFTDVAETAGVLSEEVCWGALWLDYDNNSWNDLFVGTIGSGFTTQAPNHFFISDSDGTFHEGITTLLLGPTNDGSYTAAMGDYDADGYYDFVTNNVSPSNASLWHNNGGNNKWISISLEGTISNKDGIGTWIECYSGGTKYLRYTFCGENYMGQNSEKEIFGLGNLGVVDSLKLKWLSGIEETYYNLTANTQYTFIEGQSFEDLLVDINYNGDLQICDGESIELSASIVGAYLWSNGDTTQTISVNSPGEYFVQVTNDFGFVLQSESVSIEQDSPPVVNSEVVQIDCFGNNSGSISLALAEGEIDSILWNNEAISPNLENLVAGVYSFTLFNTEGCSTTGSFELSEPSPIDIKLNTTNVLCFGQSNGTATIDITGGTPGYIVDWNGANPDSLAAGIYEVLVMDTMMCANSTIFNIVEPLALSLTLDTSAQYENGSLGSASVIIEGGTLPYQIVWSNGVEDVNEITNLIAGFYNIELTDSNGCEINEPFEIEWIIGIDGLDESGLVIFPNPSNGKINVVGTMLRGEILVLITDCTGKSIYQINENSVNYLMELDLQFLEAGIYEIAIITEEKTIVVPHIIY